MDCLFNTQIPKSSDKKIILRPTSKTFISGLASSYDTNFPEQLKGYISEREYSYMINRIVDELTMMWPCCFCFTYGYMMSLCTLGLSFLFPNCCIQEAKIKLLECINDMNKTVLNKRNLDMSYHQKCSTSWLQIEICDKEEKENGENVVLDIESEEARTKTSSANYLIKNQTS
jgi:hypothetical protein